MDERALLEVAFCADSTWTNSCDIYQQANKQLLQKVIQSKDSADNEQDIKMPPSSEDKSSVCVAAKTVRDVIPASRLATYGNYEYDLVLESLYASDHSSTQYHFDSPKSGTQEAWMLPEVEDLFQNYTAPLSSGVGCFQSSVQNTSEAPEHLTSQTENEHEIYSFFQDKCTINTDSEISLAKRIRCDSVKRLWETPFPDTRCTPQSTNLPPGPRKQTTSRLDSQIPNQYFLARQYQLWGSSSEFIPVPVSMRDNPYTLFENNEFVSTKKPAYFFPSSSEVSDSGELFPYLQEGLPIPTHTPSYAIPVIQSSQQTRSHSSGSPPAAKRIPVYQRPVEQPVERRRHGADLSNLICLSKHSERRSEEEPPPPGVDANSEKTSDINWLLLHYHPRVTTFQQSSHLADELLVMERQMDEVVAMATETLAPERPVTPVACVKLELEKDFPPINLSQKRVKSSKRNAGATPTPVAEISVDVSGPWGPRRTYKDACVNETQLSPDSAGGFGNDVNDEYDDDEEHLPDTIPESFWAPVVKDDIEHWPALADTSVWRSPGKQDEMVDDESDRVSIKDTETTPPQCLEVIEEVEEVAVEEKQVVDAVERPLYPRLEVLTARQSDEDLANKYQGLKEQALETIAVNRSDAAVGEQESVDLEAKKEGVDLEKSLLLDVPRLDKKPSVYIGESSSDDESPLLGWSAPTSEGGYVVAVGVEPRPRRKPQQRTVAASVTFANTVPHSSSPAALPNKPERTKTALPAIAFADASTGPDAGVSSRSNLTEETNTPPTKPPWLKQQRKKAAGRRKRGKSVSKQKSEHPGCYFSTSSSTERGILVKIERDLRETRSAACALVFRAVRRAANRCDANVGTDSSPGTDSTVSAAHLRAILDQNHGTRHSLKTTWDFARALVPPECPVCMARVGGVLERIREHVRVMDAQVWDALTLRVAVMLGYLTRLGKMARAAGDWNCAVNRNSHSYELHEHQLAASTSSFLDAFRPALAYAYVDDARLLRNRWRRPKETVSLNRAVFVSASCTTLIAYLTNVCEDGVAATFMHTTTFSPRGAYFLSQPRPCATSPPLRVQELNAWSILARLDWALNRFLLDEADILPIYTAPPGISVGTQTETRVAKNRLKALSKQLFQMPPPAPKKIPPGPPTPAPTPTTVNAGVGHGDETQTPGRQSTPTNAPAGPGAVAAVQQTPTLAKKRTLVSHIPVPTKVRNQTGKAAVPPPPPTGNYAVPKTPTAGYAAVPKTPTAGYAAVPTTPTARNSAVPTASPARNSAVPTASPARNSAVPTAPTARNSAVPTAPLARNSTVPTAPLAWNSAVPTAPTARNSTVPTAPTAEYTAVPTVPTAGYATVPTTPPARNAAVRSGNPKMATATPVVTKSRPEPSLGTPPGHTPEKQRRTANFYVAAPASKTVCGGQVDPAEIGCKCKCSVKRQPHTPMPTGPRHIPCGTPPARALPQAARKSNWIPEQLRQATARLFKRSARKQAGNASKEGGAPDFVVAANPQTCHVSAVADIKKRLNTTADRLKELKNDNAAARCMLDRCSRIAAGLNDCAGTSGLGDDGGQGREGNGDAANVAVGLPEQEGEAMLVGDRGDCDLVTTTF